MHLRAQGGGFRVPAIVAQLVKYVTVGALACVVYVALYALCLHVLGLGRPVAMAAAVCASIACSHLLGRGTFQRRRDAVLPAEVGLLVASIGALAINGLLLHEILSIHLAPASAQILAVTVVAPLTILVGLSRRGIEGGSVAPPEEWEAATTAALAAARRRSFSTRLLLFAAVGSFCLVLQLLILRLLKVQGLGLFAADAVGFLASAQVNFLLSYRLTWGDTARVRGRALVRKWARFNVVAGVSTLINAAVFVGVHELADDVTSVVVAGMASVVFTFVMNSVVVFRLVEEKVDRSSEPTSFNSLAWFLPAHGEAKNLPILVPEIVSYLRSLDCHFDVIVVNDGSPDDTGAVADQLAAEYPEVSVVHHDRNRGYGAALRSGFKAGLATERSLIGFCDSDLQFRIESLKPMLAEIESTDLVLGYRIQRADGIKRRLMGRGWHHLTSIILGFSARDTDCGFKLFRRDVIERLLPRLHGEHATISPELIARAQRTGFTFAEVGVEHYPRHEGEQSGASLRVVAGSLVDLLHVREAIRSV